MSDQPFVSCIMPTRNRRLFVGQAIQYFLRQTYPARELIVVDDGRDSVADLIPSDERIQYIRSERPLSLGAKRNLACQRSQGVLIAHWDDDDWMAPDRLSTQLAALQRSGALICGMNDVLYYQIDSATSWRYRPPTNGSTPPVPGTLIFRRELWEAAPFPDVTGGEVQALLRQASPAGTFILPDATCYVALLHKSNTRARNLADPAWQRVPFAAVEQLIAPDRDFYVTLRNGPRAVSAARTRSSRAQSTNGTSALTPVTVGAHYNVSTGYGSMSEYLVRGLARAGAQVHVLPFALDRSGLSAEFLEILDRSQPRAPEVAIYFSWPRPELRQMRGVLNLFINTMWESSRLPATWSDQLNRARAVIVPTTFVADVCRASGVTVPVEVVPEGIDPDVYRLVERPERPGLTTLVVGPVYERKNTLVAIAAWKQAFVDDPAARLIIKTQYNYHNYVPDDPRIQYIDRVEATRGIQHWYAQADVLLALGNEGFGLPLVEGMATGLPVIALNSEGQADVCEAAGDRVLAVPPGHWVPYQDALFGECGVRGVPDADQVTARLRWVDTHRDEARALGRAASEWARAARSIWAKGPAVLDLLEHYSRGTGSLRRARTFWIPSWPSPCGIAQHAVELARQLPSTRVQSAPPNLTTSPVLHVHHHPGLFHEPALQATLRDARRRGTPVVVTEHAVAHRPYAWEGETDALISLTSRGAELLRQRLPGHRVEHIPPGCATWFPTRKRRRGRVIGSFGFLEKHKGFWDLLDVLRALPDTELVLFSYAKGPRLAAEWEEAAGGLPVRRSATYLPAEAIAQRLAAEVDVLVFWYQAFNWVAASSAAHTALATGVPVLTSPTSWFADLRAVTYQPPDLVEGVQRLLDDTALRDHLTAAARDYCFEHRWARIAERHQDLWQSLDSAQRS